MTFPMPSQRVHHRRTVYFFHRDLSQRLPGAPPCSAGGEDVPAVRRSRPRAPRVRLNPVVVWELLDRLGIFRNELARRCGFSPGHLSMLMNGQRSPSPGARRRLMEVLGVEDFNLLFITKPAAVEGRRPEGTTSAETQKGGQTWVGRGNLIT